jgi:hypothetical protein
MNKEQVSVWLIREGWRELEDRKGYFIRGACEVVILSDTTVKYWEDLRGASEMSTFDLLISEEDLRALTS